MREFASGVDKVELQTFNEGLPRIISWQLT